MKKLKKIRQRFAGWLWDWSEYWEIPLGRMAPIVLGWAMNIKPRRVDENLD